MNFLNPILAGVGLACIAVPVVIHILMRRRRRPVAWGAMQFLLEAYRRQRRRTRLEQLLLLGARCLLVALLALALGKPVLGAAGARVLEHARTVYLVLDNSLTSSATGATSDHDASALQHSKDLAESVLRTLDAGRGDRAALLTTAMPDDAAVWPPTPDIAGLTEALRAVRARDSAADLPGAMARVRDELARDAAHPGAEVVLLSAWRTGSVQTGTAIPSLPDSARASVLAQPPAADALDNVSITDARPLRGVILARSATSSVGVSIGVSLRRSGALGAGATKVRVAIHHNADAVGQPGVAAVTWNAGQSAARVVVDLEIPPGVAQAGGLFATTTIDRDAIEGDNTFRTPLDARERLRVVILSTASLNPSAIDRYGPADWLALALTPENDLSSKRRQEGEMAVELADPTRPGALGVLRDAEAVLIPQPDRLDAAGWAEVRALLDRGGEAMVFPPADVQTHLWTDAMGEALGVNVALAREAAAPASPRLSPRPGSASAELLDMIGPELTELVRPVSVARMLRLSGPAEPVLAFDDGVPWVVSLSRKESGPDQGLLLLWTSAMDLSWTDLPTKPLMVPLLQELVRQGAGRAAGTRTAPAGVQPTLPPGAAELVRVPDLAPTPDGASVIIPVHQGRLAEAIRDGGSYRIRNAAGATLQVVSLNAPADAGQTAPQPPEVISKWISARTGEVAWLDAASAHPSGGGLGERGQAPPLSLPLLVAALAVAVVELGLGRLFSHADARTHGAPPQGVSA